MYLKCIHYIFGTLCLVLKERGRRFVLDTTCLERQALVVRRKGHVVELCDGRAESMRHHSQIEGLERGVGRASSMIRASTGVGRSPSVSPSTSTFESASTSVTPRPSIISTAETCLFLPLRVSLSLLMSESGRLRPCAVFLEVS